MKNKIKKIISLFLLTLFVGYYGSVTLFFHTHVINGVTIVHSHIHAEKHHDTQNGGHTQQSITLIAQISHFCYVDFSGECVLKPLQVCKDTACTVPAMQWVASIHLQNLSLRAPPIAA
jgi:hypothetical protein